MVYWHALEKGTISSNINFYISLLTFVILVSNPLLIRNALYYFNHQTLGFAEDKFFF